MIRVENLVKRYGPNTAINDVSFEVNQGEILGFLGPNGAGKTTTMRILSGFFPPTEGRAVVAGFDVVDEPLEVKKRVGYLPESPPLYTEMTVDAYLRFVATVKQVPHSRVESRVDYVEQVCGLGDQRKKLIKHLSKGYRQRVGLAQAIVHEPTVLILDEPTVGLDPKQIIEVRELIKSLRGGHTIILSTHILPEVSMTCERIVIINRGRIVAVDTPENLTSKLQGAERVEVEVGGEGGSLVGELEALPAVRKVTAGDLAAGRQKIFVEFDGSQDVLPVIARTVIEKGRDLYQLRLESMTLEEIFLKLTTEEEAA